MSMNFAYATVSNVALGHNSDSNTPGPAIGSKPRFPTGLYKQALGSYNTAEILSNLEKYIESSKAHDDTLFERMDFRNGFTETSPEDATLIVPGVWTFPFIKPEFCQQIVTNMDKWISDNKPMQSFGTGEYELWNDLQKSPRTASLFMQKIMPYIPSEYTDKKNEKWVFTGVNPMIPWAVYNENQEFGIHQDTSVKHSTGVDKFTCLIYLNDTFEGGETVFYQDADGKNEVTTIKPKTGMALLFDIDWFHSGNKVKNGKKHWIGFEIIMAQVTSSDESAPENTPENVPEKN